MTLLSFALAYAGLFSLRLAAGFFPTLLFTRNLPGGRKVLLRLFGALLLGQSYGLCVSSFGWALGSIFWPVLLTPMALAVVVLPAYAPRAAAAIAVAGPVISLSAALIGAI